MNIETNKVVIIPFSNDLKEHIKTLNLEWLQKYFKVEPKDERVLSDPQGEIIDKDGMIFYAQYNNLIIGTVSLLRIDSSTFELTKMAVSNGNQGLGVGKKLMEHCLSEAKRKGIQKLILYSNKKLTPAIHLYKSYGFTEIPLEDGVYERADIKMEKDISYI